METALDSEMSRYAVWGPGQMIVFLSVAFSTFTPLATMVVSYVFFAWTPPHTCTTPESLQDASESSLQCGLNDSCTAWNYSTPGGEHTVVMEFNLVCSNGAMVELSESLSTVGSIIAQLFLSHLIDRWGRRLTHIISILSAAIFGLVGAFAVNYIMFVVMRFLLSSVLVCIRMSGVTLILEHVSSRHRTQVGIGLEFIWVIAYLYLGLIAYFVRDWRYQMATLSATNLVWILHICYLPESVPWLITKGRLKEADKTLRKMAKKNNVTYPTSGLFGGDVTPSKISETESGNLNLDSTLDLFRDRRLLKHLVISSLLWFTNQLVYFGIMFSSPSLTGDKYVNFFISGLVEVPAYIITYYTVRRSRRLSTCAFLCLSGASLMTAALLKSGDYNATVTMVVTHIGKFAITGSFAVIIVYTNELFPTTLRGTSNGFYNMFGMLGNLLAPFVAYTAKHSLTTALILMGCLSCSVGVTSLALPETTNKPLAMTRYHLEELLKKDNQSSSPPDTDVNT